MTSADEVIRAIVCEEVDKRLQGATDQTGAYSVDEVAQLLSISRRHVYEHLLTTGRLRTIKVGRRVLIPAAEVRALMDEAT